MLDSGNFRVFGLVLEVQVSERVETTVGWGSPRLDKIGSLRGELSCGALVDCFLHATRSDFT